MYSIKSVNQVVITVVFTALAAVAVALRFKVRYNLRAGIGIDDYIILAALAVQIGAAGMSILGAVAGGSGDNPENLFLHPIEATRYTNIHYAGPFLVATIIALIKFSTCVLYKRIFTQTTFGRACNVLMVLTAAWFLASIIGQACANFEAKPTSSTSSSPSTFNFFLFLTIMAALNILLDLITVCLPLFVIRSLQMSFKRKLVIASIFSLGIFCVIAAAVRVYYTARLVQAQAQGTELIALLLSIDLWAVIEPCSSIVAACLPTLAPFVRGRRDLASIIRSVRSILSLNSRHSSRSETQNKPNPTGDERDTRHGKNAWQKLSVPNDSTKNLTSAADVELGDMPATPLAPRSIMVETMVESRSQAAEDDTSEGRVPLKR
ncbi:hypothetical protein MMC26_005170 [Xylographa opegraphella]|nr:hypothetical protein [Xylographa opegraphella]